MNADRGVARLRQPRSNAATNMLFVITFMVFALLAETAIDQQQGGIADAGVTQEALETVAFGRATMAVLGLRALVRP